MKKEKKESGENKEEKLRNEQIEDFSEVMRYCLINRCLKQYEIEK